MSKLLNCLFVYDNKFSKYRNNVYTSGRLTNSVFKRYAARQDPIIVITRMQSTETVKKLNLVNLDNLKFKPVKGINFSEVFTKHFLYNFNHVTKEIRNSDYIVVRLPSFLGIFVLSLNMLYQRPTFIEVVGDAENALLMSHINPSLFFKLFSKIIYKLNKYFIKHANGVIYVTQSALQVKYPTNGYSAAASNVEIDIPERHLNFKDYELKGESFHLGLIADYNNHYKGIKELIHSIRDLKELGYNIKLSIVGSGSLLKFYKELANRLLVSDNVSFKGRLKDTTDILEFLESLDLYVHPSYTEGLPRALIEAMSVGLPAAATDVGGIPELLDDQFLVPPKNSTQLTNKIIAFLDSQSLRYKAGIANYTKSKDYDQKLLNQRRTVFWDRVRDTVRSKINR